MGERYRSRIASFIFSSTRPSGTWYLCSSFSNSLCGVVNDWYVVMNVCKKLLSAMCVMKSRVSCDAQTYDTSGLD